MAVWVSSDPASAYVAVTVTSTPCWTIGPTAASASVGALLDTVTWAVSVSHSPVLSHTWSVAVKAASSAAWKPAWAVDALVNAMPTGVVVHTYVAIVPSTSVEPVPSSTRSTGGVASVTVRSGPAAAMGTDPVPLSTNAVDV